MESKPKKIIINIDDCKHQNWKLFLGIELRKIKSKNIEIDAKNIDLSCKDIKDLVEIANQYDSEIISFCSSSSKTVICAHSLGYRSQFITENHSKQNIKTNEKELEFSETYFHQGTVRSGEYLDVPGGLLILGDVNPGAIVRAEENIIIWGRLLGIAHAGSTGNSKATISALQLKPVQLRISNKIARGPKDELQLGLAEQAKIDFNTDKIVISHLDSNYFAKLNQKRYFT